MSYTINEKSILRVRYEGEQHDWHADRVPCHDCGVLKGEFHAPSCDVEECPVCGDHLITCDRAFEEREQAF